MQSKIGTRRSESDNLRASAKKKLEDGDYTGASDSYKMAVILNPRIRSDVILDWERMLEINDTTSLRLSLADFYLKLGDVEGAITELEEVLDIDPALTSVYNLLGRIFLRRGAVDEAVLLLERALSADLKDTSLTEMLAGAYLEQGNIKRSIGLYEEMLLVSPAGKKTLRVLGDLYARVGQKEAAAAMFLKLFETDPDAYDEVVHKFEGLMEGRSTSGSIREMLAGIHLRKGNSDKAAEQYRELFKKEKFRAADIVQKYREALKISPEHPGLVNALADALVADGSYTEAAQEYKGLFRAGGQGEGTAIEGYLNILKKYPEHLLAHKFLGEAYDHLGRYEDALEEYRKVILLDQSEAEPISRRCREILKTRPDLAALHQVLGDIFIIKKEFRKAVAEAEEIIGVDGKSLDAYLLLGDGYRGLNMYAKASDSFSMALSIDPYNISVHKKLEEVRNLEVGEAIKAVKGRIREDQWRMSLHLDLAKLYLEIRDFEGAMAELQQALRDQTRAPFAYNLMGLSLKEQGKFELAVSQFKKALEVLPPELAELEKSMLSNLGSTYEALGRIDEAISTYEKIREKDVDFGGVDAKIGYLSSMNPLSLRDKMFALVVSDRDSRGLIEMWGGDPRRLSKKAAEDMGVSFAQTHNEKGFELMLKDLYKSAEEKFLQAVSLDERLPSALNNLAVIYVRQGHLDDAKAKVSAALLEDPKHAVLHNNLGVISYLKGEDKEAELEFLRALSLDPRLAVAHLNLGDTYYSGGNAKQALQSWERVKNFSVVSEIAARRLRYKTPNTQ